ncbi:hypothetical protein F1F79_02460 [Listeria monocytogenes]|uniref:hypothetical protein n=1 Tax=Listeria monocytogenes TaxID=1639 RepID=UPI0004D4AB8E|nr:hypothetical protein [Listeria monocytogenes]EAC3172721.1 hypothetical protein [Listeria monocytogenes]EAC7981566.1 hypothetical protein [Listeria monocytogenes]EAD1582461.1 hypothetical protein [Listeria monocytogenes]EAD2068763.1 hypothetical protein [Listeria monocytogenes]EAD2074960.1 hypothetical protein [Listeria monocytogenes]
MKKYICGLITGSLIGFLVMSVYLTTNLIIKYDKSYLDSILNLTSTLLSALLSALVAYFVAYYQIKKQKESDRYQVNAQTLATIKIVQMEVNENIENLNKILKGHQDYTSSEILNLIVNGVQDEIWKAVYTRLNISSNNLYAIQKSYYRLGIIKKLKAEDFIPKKDIEGLLVYFQTSIDALDSVKLTLESSIK